MRLERLHIQGVVRRALEEDIGYGDLTTRSVLSPDLPAEGWIIAEEPLVVAGLDAAREVFSTLDPGAHFDGLVEEGKSVKEGERIVSVRGRGETLLSGERVALNFLQKLSGIASLSRQFAERVRGTGARIVDTRKTTPGLRVLEKYAVTVGGCHNHRFGLFDGVLIKENHIAMAGGIAQAVRRLRQNVPHTVKIEVETRNLREVREALEAGAEVIMLDNMEPTLMKKAVKEIRDKGDRRVLIEASGRMSLEKVREAALTGVDLISVGALVHSARWMDISMDILPSRAGISRKRRFGKGG
jgi:nicotinate-nucleotide pyrophosphorylase (carboxylating)